MKVKQERRFFKGRLVKPWMYAAALLVNLLVFIFIGWVYLSSSNSYSEKLFNENIHNVDNLNIASANAAYTYTTGMGVKIDDIVSYIEARGLNREEAVKYLSESNTDPDRQIQLVLSGNYGSTGKLSFGDYSGVSIRKMKKVDGSLETLTLDIKYGSGYYDIFRSFTDVNDESFHGVCFAPEFTDPDTKLKCFAVYRHTDLIDSDGKKSLYTVLLAVNSKTALNAYDAKSEYEGQSSVLVNSDGDYIIKNSDYRNMNFFDYIVNYNGLTLDWKDQIKAELVKSAAQEGSPVNLFYKNHQGNDCVFSVVAIENGWYSITCVPLSSFNLENEAPDYSLIILVMFLVLFVLDGLAMYIIAKDMSRNVALAKRATKEANDANQAKSRFLSTMSHELRTPLNAIIGLVSLSGDSLDNAPVLKDYLKKIDISSKLLLQLISDILDVSAIESNKMKLNNSEFDITRLITSLSAIYYDQCAAKGIEFSVSLKNMHSETLIGDSVRVNQVLLNFLSNAVKFTPSGGKVSLSAEQKERAESSVVIRFSISDTGCGISDDLRARLFQPFERASGDASRKYSGTGLGLSIAKNLTELMQGSVGVESTEGIGSCFWADIPFCLPAVTARRSFSPIEDMNVLAAVCDDDEREYIGQILSGFGVANCLTGSAGAAMELLKEKRSDGKKGFDICILDWKMTDLNGLDAAKRIRKEFDSGQLRIILLAYDLTKVSADCSSAGADLVIGKPVFPSALYNVLEEISSNQARPISVFDHDFDLTGRRVLLVEDNKLNTEIARLLFEKVGIDVETAENGKDGVSCFVASRPGHFDAVLMDIQMPVMDGYQATAAIRASGHKQASTVPIIAMTADAFAEDVARAHEAGMNEHISKPVVPEILYSVLKNSIR